MAQRIIVKIGNKKINIKENIGQIIYAWICLFFFLFEFPLFRPITTRMFAVIMATLYLIFNQRKMIKICKGCKVEYVLRPLVWLIIPAGLLIVNSINVNKISTYNYYEPRYFIYLFVYIVLMCIFFLVICKDIYEFAYIYISMLVLQSFIVYMALINTTFRLFIYEHFYMGDNRFDMTIKNGTRIIGIGLHSSTGSLIMLGALILLVYLAKERKINNILFSVVYILILGAAAFIGRTGFYSGIFILLCYLCFTRGFARKVSFILLGIVALAIGAKFIFSNLNSNILSFLLEWIGEAFNEETRYKTITTLNNMEIPELTMETFFGTTVMRGISANGTRIAHDSGYVEIYFSLGLLGAIFYYFSFLKMFLNGFKRIKQEKLFFLFMLLILMFVFEWKEPYIQKYVFTFLLLTITLFERKSEIRKEIILEDK